MAGPRERLIASAIELMRERGVHATGLSDLLERSRTARGSIYQHFPSGKIQLMAQATLDAGRVITSSIDELARTLSTSDLLDTFVEGWKRTLSAGSFGSGCPIVAAAQAGPDALAVRDASAEVFADWVRVISGAIESSGVDQATATSLGSFVVSAVEGAIIQCRSARSLQPLEDARVGLRLALDAANRPH